jgi:uncharacterized protein YecT (DUF1311 family)
MNLALKLFAASVFAASVGANAAECDDPKTSDEIAQCLGKELRNSDARINSSYKELMGKLNDSDKIALRQTQRAWIKDRDSICKLDTKESNREKWYQALLQDYAKTVCVTRYTRKRTTDLESMLATLSPQHNDANARPNPVPPAPPPTAASPEVAFDRRPATVHAKGKWYFELAVDYAKAVKIEPFVLSVGVKNDQTSIGILDNVRIRDAARNIMRYGFAVDLDNGKLYFSQNGNWVQGEPGSNSGHDLKLGRDYYASFMVSADNVVPYLEQKAIVPNFGDTAMTYALPAGYRPWRNRMSN